MMTFHFRLNVPKSLTLCTLPMFGGLCISFYLLQEASLMTNEQGPEQCHKEIFCCYVFVAKVFSIWFLSRSMSYPVSGSWPPQHGQA